MRKLSPQRRRATIFAALASILASLPTLLLEGHVPTRGLDFLRGLCLGVSLALLMSAIVCLHRDQSSRRAG